MSDDDGMTLVKVDVETRAFLMEKCGVSVFVPFVLSMHRQDGSTFGGCYFLTLAAVAEFLDHMAPVRFEIFCACGESGAEIERLLKEVSKCAVH